MSEHEVWNDLGNLYALSCSYEQAIQAYEKALALNPSAGESCNNIAQVYMLLGRFPEAIEYYQKGIDLLQGDRHRAMAIHRLGDAHLHLKEYAKAMDCYQKADKLVLDIHQTINENRISDLLLASRLEDQPSDGAQTERVDNEPSASSSGMELLPFIEELTPWWFDGQNPPEEDSTTDVYWPPATSHGIDEPGGNMAFTGFPNHDWVASHRTLEDFSPYKSDENDAEIRAAPEFLVQTITDEDAVRYEAPEDISTAEFFVEEQTDIEKINTDLEIDPDLV